MTQTINEARTLANIAKRAETLFDAESGYTYERFADCATRYFVENPEGDLYLVDTESEFCSCMAFEQHNICKHLLAVQAEETREAEQVARLEFEHEARYYMGVALW